MATSYVSLVFCLCVYTFSVDILNGQGVPYTEKYYTQTVDHFNYLSYGNKTFQQRYLIQDKWWKRGVGPIFFYTGNEGAITDFWEATGFVTDIAPQFEALVVFAEHRFYGKSLPFGDDSFKSPEIGLLTMEQAMADYAVFLTDLKKQLNATNCRVISFGGSYGGMLTAYMRFKYPNIIDGGIAASAPIYMLDPSHPRDFFFPIVSNDFDQAMPGCQDNVKKAFSQLNNMAAQGQSGLSDISRMFNLCKPLADNMAFKHLLGWVRNAFTFMAMLDYPYKASFEAQLPANPVKAGCLTISSASDVVTGLAAAAGIFYNGTAGTLKCYDIDAEFIECADPTGCGTGNDAKAWDYQACTEIKLPAGSNNVTDMFPVLPFTTDMRNQYCLKTWGVMPRDEWSSVQFFGQNIKSASNLVFSNGNLDPWNGAGVTKDVSDTVRAVWVQGGAHHLDLRHWNQADPIGVKAREFEKSNIRQWINAP
ncbi:dipeptidyl peptidase 2-like isoform X1 [Haliotis rubra]|uniref:dipeptidyl peptidase 2-like isoform X1 n=1 Tax=Haliotis rubra TaxID=36100 RepID=UPI001EE5CBE5|nr:dipeptidyl peptidase 2-like isoform X1 [Haliotis rubra]